MDASIPRQEIERLEDAAARAVPAAEVAELGRWLLRATPGLRTKRTNSVLARDAAGEVVDLAGRLEAVEAFYRARGLPSRYQLNPASGPDGLVEALVARGYRASPPVDVEHSTLEQVAEIAAPAFETTLTAQAGAEWRRTWGAAVGVDRTRAAAAGDLFARILAETAFGCVHGPDGTVIAVGMAVRDGGRLGLFNMATLPEWRGRGAGRAALRALAHWGRSRGAREAYLQVELENEPACALYRRAGFRSAYRYAYLTAASR